MMILSQAWHSSRRSDRSKTLGCRSRAVYRPEARLAQFVLHFELGECYLPKQQFFGIVRDAADQ